MTTQPTAAPAKMIRLLHGSMLGGILLFAGVAQFVLRPTMTGSLPPTLVQILLGVALAACAASLVLRKRVRPRSTDESADLFWTTSITPALVTWASLEIASLITIIVYMYTGSTTAIAVAAIPILLFIWLNPASLEKT